MDNVRARTYKVKVRTYKKGKEIILVLNNEEYKFDSFDEFVDFVHSLIIEMAKLYRL